FLAAGSVIHAVGTQDLFKMGGLRKPMRVTSIAFAIGALSLSGIPPFAGFFSKDDVLASVYTAAQSQPAYWPFLILAYATVFLTAYYIFRAWYLAFSGDRTRDPTLPHAHEGPWVMQVPLYVLSALAVVAGVLPFLPSFASLFSIGTGGPVPPTYGTTELLLSVVSVGLGLGGILLARVLWGNGRVFTLAPDSSLQPMRTILLQRYYVKAGYDWVGLQLVYGGSRVADFFERYVIDGTIHGFERLGTKLSDGLRKGQTGLVSDYASYVVAGVIGLLVLLLFVAPLVIASLGGS
ncbi:MAG: proton-conducting transporter membrane subunit, partial [Candidatus Lutacidiplasmatales archaeon]